jgi:hypothetical protein
VKYPIIIDVIGLPYRTAHDYISFDVYLTKNNIKHPEALESNQRSVENADRYIDDYMIYLKIIGQSLLQ